MSWLNPEEYKEKVLNHLHKTVGYCRHCGKQDCAGKASGSYLLAIDVDDLIEALDSIKAEPPREEISY